MSLLRRAEEEARAMGDRAVCASHLQLALTQEPEAEPLVKMLFRMSLQRWRDVMNYAVGASRGRPPRAMFNSPLAHRFAGELIVSGEVLPASLTLALSESERNDDAVGPAHFMVANIASRTLGW